MTERVYPVEFARFDANGQYITTGVVPSDSITLAEPDVYIGSVNMLTQYHDTVENLPVDIPQQPSPNHRFDFVQKEWIDPRTLEEVKALKHTAIEVERDRILCGQVIVYDGMNLDADKNAKQNLQDKITATNSRISRGTPTPPQMLVWKDHDNVIRPFPDLETYKHWLEGFAIALENRGMMAWAWSWQMKDYVDSLTTVDEVSAFNPVFPE